MASKKKTNISTIGFFRYFQNIVGIHMYGYLFLNFLVGLMDGLGLAMFVPLLAMATGSGTGGESLGKLQFLVDVIEKSGFELNLFTALALMVILFILKGIFYYIRIIYFIKIKLKSARKIRMGMVTGLKELSYRAFTESDAGRIQNNMVGETNKLIAAMTMYFSGIQHVVMLLTYVVLAMMSNLQFAIMVGIGALITNFAYKYINKVTKELARKQTLVGHDFNGNLIQAINNFKYLKATNYFRAYEYKLKKNIEKSEEYSYKIGSLGAIAESLREPMIILVIAAVILIHVQFMGGNFATIMVSLLLFYRSLSHLVTLQNVWNKFLGSAAGLVSVELLMDEFRAGKEPQSQSKIEEISDIIVHKISISYGNTKILKDISLHIPAKTSIALVGESGAGKTTLANIICGLLPPQEGKVTLGNQNLYESDLNSVRDKVGYITQEPVIFDDTVFNNITFWSPKTPETIEKFNKTLEMVSMLDFVQSLENKEDSRLGNNGILISGGQKQRISIARELYKDVQLLIMDEATSALDSETEQYIKENIDMLHGKFTMVIIAHRLSTVKNVDQVYLLEKGEIVDNGRFNELAEKSEKFRKMVQLQEV